jgi:hypothetical protein
LGTTDETFEPAAVAAAETLCGAAETAAGRGRACNVRRNVATDSSEIATTFTPEVFIRRNSSVRAFRA